ncbi:MAG: IPT/TIG domain-containing protein, partial [Herbiconiux sp.]|nr:IPT/TIG domain-containing protein [Herbiconiux sp.]
TLMVRTANGRKLALLTAATAAALGGAAAPASAAPVTINYGCELPFLGVQPTSATVNVDYPANVPANTQVPGQPITNTVSFNGDSTIAFEVVGAATLDGVHRLGVAYTTPTLAIPAKVPTTFAGVAVPTYPNPTVVPSSGSTPAASFPDGPVSLNATSLSSIVQMKDAAGQIIELDENVGAADGDPTTFTTACTQVAGQNTQLDSFTVGAVVGAPTVSRILPRTVKANKKTTVVITGTKLKNATSVKVGGVAATFTVINKRLIQARVPALPAGTYPLTVTTPGGTSAVTAQTTVTYQ